MEAYLDDGESLTKPIGAFAEEKFELRTEKGDLKVQLSDDRVRVYAVEGNLRFVVRPDKGLVQLKAGDMHFTIDMRNCRFIRSDHPKVTGADPNPED